MRRILAAWSLAILSFLALLRCVPVAQLRERVLDLLNDLLIEPVFSRFAMELNWQHTVSGEVFPISFQIKRLTDVF